MKVLHVETGRHLYGGAEQVLWLAGALRNRGCDSPLVCARGSAMAAAARAAGLEVFALPCAGDLDLRFGWRLKRLLERERPDLVHCHSRRGADLLGGRAAGRAGIPAVVSRRVDNREAPWLARLRYRPFAGIVAISETIAEVLCADGIAPERITVIRSAVDTARFERPPDCAAFRREFGLEADQRVLFCAAQLISRKGQRFLLEALASLKVRYPELRAILFGRGPLEAELRALATNLELGGIVQFAGFRDDLDDYLGCADLLVHPALTEGLGVAALKAAAAGVPVVAFAAGGLREAVVDGETGLLTPPGDADALARAIAGLLDDPERCRQLGRQGRRRMQAEFTVAAMADAHMTLYRTILDGRA